ncbi:NUDIX domain-containing protein [Streptomyces sp. NPDC059466]|uniref:NUDIX domain-containing protein n=1 Tax=Streptomyces sp. NPDC059466 TaxID=3346843 RepID=UPI0036866A2B
MTGRRSAGLLLYRRAEDGLEVLLGHMGGPFYARRDAGAWTVPKGEYGPDESAWDAARRGSGVARGRPPPEGGADPLGERGRGGALDDPAGATAADLDPATVVPGTFEMEWPPRSGRRQEFPELDRVEWFGLDRARAVVVPAQAAFVDRLAEHQD